MVVACLTYGFLRWALVKRSSVQLASRPTTPLLCAIGLTNFEALTNGLRQMLAFFPLTFQVIAKFWSHGAPRVFILLVLRVDSWVWSKFITARLLGSSISHHTTRINQHCSKKNTISKDVQRSHSGFWYIFRVSQWPFSFLYARTRKGLSGFQESSGIEIVGYLRACSRLQLCPQGQYKENWENEHLHHD